MEKLFNLDRTIIEAFPRLAKWLRNKFLKILSYLNRLIISGKVRSTKFTNTLVDQITSTLQYLEEIIFEEWKRRKEK